MSKNIGEGYAIITGMKKLALGFAFIFLLTGCVSLEAPKVTYLDSRVSRVTLEGVQLDFFFNVANKNPIPLDISSYSYKVFINGRELLSENRTGFNLPAHETKSITLSTFVRFDRVIDSAFNVGASILAGNLFLDYRIEGSVSAGSLGITVIVPLKASGRIRILREALKI